MTVTQNYSNIIPGIPILSADPNVKEDVMTDQQKNYDTLLPPQQRGFAGWRVEFDTESTRAFNQIRTRSWLHEPESAG